MWIQWLQQLMAGDCIINLLFWVTFIIQTSNTEIIYPAKNQNITCGLTDSCTIRCRNTYQCQYSIFNVYNNIIEIECSSLRACESVQIFSHNVQSLNVTFTETLAFRNGILSTDSSTHLVNVKCVVPNGDYFTCSKAQFYYNGHGLVKHTCNGAGSCSDAIIHANSPISFHAINSGGSYSPLSLMFPTNKTRTQLSSIHVYGDIEIVIFSLHGISNSQIHCNLNGSELSSWAPVIYGFHGDKSCSLTDYDCIDSIGIPDSSLNITVVEAINDLNFSGLHLQGNIFIIISRPQKFWNSTLVPPIYSHKDSVNSWISILCIGYESCGYISFFLEPVTNATIIASIGTTLYGSDIFGPDHFFQFVGYERNVEKTLGNTYHLQNTDIVAFDSQWKSDIYLGDATDFDLQCGANSNCHDLNIYSNISPKIYCDCPEKPWYLQCSNIVIYSFDGNCTYTCGAQEPYDGCLFVTVPPTTSPTNTPTNPPTESPTIMPTYPSTSPSFSPTFAPSYPTDTPSKNPSTSPSYTPYTSSSETYPDRTEKNNIFQPNNLSKLYELIQCGFAILCFLWGFAAYIDAQLIRVNDYFRIGAIFSVFIQTSDLISDCFFVAELRSQNKDYIMFYFCIVFIIVPALITVIQLYFYLKKHWLNNDRIRSWVTKYSKILLLLSIFSGSSFTAVTLSNSNMFKFQVFDMGLTDRELKKFSTKRIYSIVFLENMPQLCIQSYYIWSTGTYNDAIVISSIIFSLISIFVSILSMTIEKTINYTQRYTIISMNVSGNCIVSNSSKYKTITIGLRDKLARLFGIDKHTLEVIKPTDIRNGFAIDICAYMNEMNDVEVNLQQILIDANQDGELSKIFKDHWELSKEPTITDIKCVVIESKQDKNEAKQMQDNISIKMETQMVKYSY